MCLISQKLILYYIHDKWDANSGPIGTFLNYKCVMMKPSPWGSLGRRWILKFCPFFHNGCQYWASSIRSSYFGIFSMWNHLGSPSPLKEMVSPWSQMTQKHGLSLFCWRFLRQLKCKFTLPIFYHVLTRGVISPDSGNSFASAKNFQWQVVAQWQCPFTTLPWQT